MAQALRTLFVGYTPEASAAYRKEQSENFPKGIETFPDNFVCDFASVDDNQAFHIGGKGNEKLCGLYAPGFGCMLDYLFLRMTLAPYQDPWVRVKEFCDFAYGPAGDDVAAVIRELDNAWFETQTFVEIDAGAKKMTIYKGADLARWQKLLADAEKKLGDDPIVRRNFSWVRWSIDFLTLTFWRDVRTLKNPPDWLTAERVYERMRTVTLPYCYGSAPKKGAEPKGLYAKAKNAYLITKALDKPIPDPLCAREAYPGCIWPDS